MILQKIKTLSDRRFAQRACSPIRPCLLARRCCVLSSLILLFSALVLPCGAATTNAPGTGPAKRYLFIVNTSSAMQKRLNGILLAVETLLKGGFNHQLQKGDTIGIWTYNDQVHAGSFPLARWTPETHKSVGTRILQFINNQQFEKKAKLESVLPAMERVVTNSDFITLIFVTDGLEPMKGTPFDQQINEVYAQWKADQQKVQMPLVTLVRARKGQFLDFVAGPGQWPLEVPPLPVDMRVTNSPPSLVKQPGTNRTSQVGAAMTAAKPTNQVILPPLIVSGKKPQPVAPVPLAEERVTSAAVTNEGAKVASPVERPSTNPPQTVPRTSAESKEVPRTSSPAAVSVPEQPVTALVEAKPASVPQPVDASASVPSNPVAADEAKAAGGGTPVQVRARSVEAPPANAIQAAVVRSSGPSRLLLWMLGAFTFGAALIAILFALRRQPRTKISLITRSLDQEEKK